MPSIEGGGVEKNLFLISNYLSGKLDNIHIITASKNYKNKFKNINFINPRFNTKNYGRKIKYLLCLVKLIQFLLKNKNTLVFSFQANLYAILISKFFNVKIIIRSNSSPSGWTQNILKKYIFKFLFKKADKIIVNSQKFKLEFKKKFNINAIKIYNPLNKNQILKLSKKKKFLPFFDNHPKLLKIINIGRLTDQKDQMLLLRSVRNLKSNFRLLIIGKGANFSTLKNYIDQNFFKDEVKIINYQRNPFPYLKKADLFILTSKFEGLPNVLLEAAVLKKFIISTDCPTGPKEILLNGKCGILCPVGDHKKITTQIEYYDKNKKILKRKVKKLYKSLDRFDFKTNQKLYLDVLKKYL